MAALTGLDKKRDVVHHDTNSLVTGLTIGRVCRRKDIRVNDLVEPVPRVVIGEHDSRQCGAIELPVGDNTVPKFADDVGQSPRAGFNNAPGKHVMVNDAGPQLTKTRRGSRLPSADSARKSDA